MIDHGERNRMGRRTFLRRALKGLAGVAVTALIGGCTGDSSHRADETPSPAPAQPTSASSKVFVEPVHTPTSSEVLAQPVHTPTQPTSTGSKVLLVYFSRAGENFSYGGRTQLEVGNTEVLAGMIRQRITCDVHRIQTVDPYPDDYEETRERNVQEQEADARPAIANPLSSIEPYDIVLLGSPIWNVRAPMIMTTFVEGFNFIGKTVIPFTTHAGSGLGTTAQDYKTSCPGAAIGEGLAVRGEEVRDAGEVVEAWLRKINLLKA